MSRRGPALHGEIADTQTRRNGLGRFELQALAQRVAGGDVGRDALAELRVLAEEAADQRVTLGSETRVDERVEIVFADRRVRNHFTLRNCGADPVSIA